MKVAIAAAGRFHSFHLANQLNKNRVLEKIFTTSLTQEDLKYLNKNLVKQNLTCKLLETFIIKAKLLKLINRPSWYIFKDNLFDRWLSKEVRNIPRLDIFVGWAHHFEKSIPQIRKTGAKIILESGSTHIQFQNHMLKEEFKKFGLNWAPIHPKNIEKMLNEYEHCDFIMTPSEFVRKSFLEKGFDSKKILKVPYGVDLSLFNYLEKEQPSKFNVLFVGNIGLQKGIIYLLKAWKKLNLPSHKATLTLVGNIDSEFYKIAHDLIKSKNIVMHKSVPQKELLNFYKNASVFVMPSIQEGLAMVQAEAMASGLPLICTKNTGGEELIENGKQGFVIEPRNIKSLSEKIEWCFLNQDKCFHMGKEAFKKIQQFSWDSYGDKILEIYKKIASG